MIDSSASAASFRSAADLFYEIVSAFAAEEFLADARNTRHERLAEKLRESLRSRDQIKKIAADGFEVCVRALAELGAKDVSIHECGKEAFGEQPWGERTDDVE